MSAHEFWLLPKKFQPQIGETIEIEVRNGQKFVGGALGYFQFSIERFETLQNGATTRVKSRSGDFPAASLPADTDGLMVVVYQSTPSTLTYRSYELFKGFTEHKKLGDTLARHDARGLPHEGIRESYTRFSKSLIGVGTAKGADQNTGLLTEIVALKNPYTDDLAAGLPVLLLYQNKPRSNEQIEIFEKNTDGVVTITTTTTNDKGVAIIPVNAGSIYMLDAEVMREPDAQLVEEKNVMWESLWANLTFQVPNK